MTVGWRGRKTDLMSRGGGEKDDGSKYATRATEPHPETHRPILIAGACRPPFVPFSGKMGRRSCSEEADDGALAGGRQPKPSFSLLWHLPIILCGDCGGVAIVVGGGGRSGCWQRSLRRKSGGRGWW